MSEEVRTTVGFLKLPDGPIELDYENIELTANNYGADVLQQEPIVIRASNDIQRYRNYYRPPDEISDEELFTHAIKHITNMVLHHLEHHRIPGEIVLHYESIRLRWDIKVICAAYNCPERERK